MIAYELRDANDRWTGQIQGATSMVAYGEAIPLDGKYSTYEAALATATVKAQAAREQRIIDAKFGGDLEAFNAAKERAFQRMKRK